MSQNQPCVAVLAANWVDEMEILYPIWRLHEEGIEVDVLTTDGKAPTRGEHDLAVNWYLEQRKVHRNTIKIEDADPDDYVGVLCPGGYSQDFLRHLPEVQALLKAMDRENKLIAAICHGIWTPISAGIVRGRRCTCVPKIKDDAINAGAEWHDEQVVIDRNLITSRTPPDLGAYCRAICDYIGSYVRVRAQGVGTERPMRLAHTMLRVRDLDTAIDFYTRKLGLELREVRALPGADATLAFIREPRSGHEIELTYNHDDRDYTMGDAFGHIAFYVDSVDDVYREWAERGVPFSLQPKTMKNGTRIAFAVDPMGYKLELVERPEMI